MLSIPTIQTCEKMKVKGQATVALWNGGLQGKFVVDINARFDPQTTEYPTGIVNLKWNRPETPKGEITSEVIQQLTLGLIKVGPTVFISGTGKCTAGRGCRYWIMIAKESGYSKEAPDIISFLITDNVGKMIAHGAGAVIEGDIKVS
jgi:hypothetical protein